MDEQNDAAFFKSQIEKAESYHDLVVLRSRFFSLMERTLPKEECQAIKDYWQERAKDDDLPIAPPAKVEQK